MPKRVAAAPAPTEKPAARRRQGAKAKDPATKAKAKPLEADDDDTASVRSGATQAQSEAGSAKGRAAYNKSARGHCFCCVCSSNSRHVDWSATFLDKNSGQRSPAGNVCKAC